MENDTFLTFASAPHLGLRNKSMKVNLPLSSEMAGRLKRALIQLKLEERDETPFEAGGESSQASPRSQFTQREFLSIPEPEISRISSRDAPAKIIRRESYYKAPESPVRQQPVADLRQPSNLLASLVKKKSKLEIDKITEIAVTLTLELIEEVVDFEVPVLTRESSVEVMVAALILHSSNILDRIIVDVLRELIPEVAREAWSEETDIEYIDFQVLIVDSVIELELDEGIHLWIREVLADEVKTDFLKDVYFEDIVQEAIDEEIEWNSKIVVEVYCSLIDDIMDEEWVELLAESELEEALLDSKRSDMSVALQRELYSREKKFFIAKIADSMWFDWLNTIVASTWLPRVVEECVEGEDIPDEQLFKFQNIPERSSSRKPTFSR
jgi:hypothetical protein